MGGTGGDLVLDDRVLIVAAECLRHSFAPCPEAAIVNAVDSRQEVKKSKEPGDGGIEETRLERRARVLREEISGEER